MGFIKSEFNTSYLMDQKVAGLFMPHGLGHLMGLGKFTKFISQLVVDVHDTTVYPVENLQENMIITVEPGIYFGKSILSDEALEKNGKSKV
jgi:Xaa-Pro aminopeptidase